jgi:hypothetical protein
LLVAAIKDASARHGLKPVLVAAVVEQESGGQQWATRHEPNYIWLWPAGGPVTPPRGVSYSTEVNQQRTSWGLMQVMGAVARERGCREPFLACLCDPALGLEYGCRHLLWLRQRFGYPPDSELLAAYNAGSPASKAGQQYATEVLSRVPRLNEFFPPTTPPSGGTTIKIGGG